MTTGVSIDTKQNNGELIAKDTAPAAHFSAPFGLILHFSPGVLRQYLLQNVRA
jgi:hypothetical protein